MRLRQKFIIIFLGAAAPLVVVNLLLLQGLSRTEALSNKIIEAEKARFSMLNLHMDLYRAFMPTHDYLISGEEEERKLYKQYRMDIEDKFRILRDVAERTPYIDVEGLTNMENHFKEVDKKALEILDLENPVGNPAGSKTMYEMDKHLEALIACANQCYAKTQEKVKETLQAIGEEERSITRNITYIVFTACLIAVALGAYSAHYVTRPLKDLCQAASHISQGDFWHRVNITTGDELEELSNSINKMNLLLKESFETLEAKVVQRTAALHDMVNKLERVFKQTVEAMAETVDQKSPWTFGHSRRVTQYAVTLGQRLGLKKEDLESLRTSALLHDIGKIGVPETIVDKEGPLTVEEQEVMQRHPRLGVNILSPIEAFGEILPTVLYHHENYDGTGYPQGLKGEEIPLLGRILRVADAYDAMRCDRPYRKGKDKDTTIEEIRADAGTIYDPHVVEALVEVVDKMEGS
ncbi:MAG: HD domain-containing protein [Candidatus Brocadiales bacterium]|nr:HD domain-containing protein [Candidatus Brocadiales bacterium]